MVIGCAEANMETEMNQVWRVVGVTKGGAPRPQFRQPQRTTQLVQVHAQPYCKQKLFNPRRQHRQCHVQKTPWTTHPWQPKCTEMQLDFLSLQANALRQS